MFSKSHLVAEVGGGGVDAHKLKIMMRNKITVTNKFMNS